ncbi:MAG TPA: hypothetical protein PLG22_18660, partial [Kiritimatiellia bacterium]|nr:hypothetical protein [Kiritimatiellia bacterium]
ACKERRKTVGTTEQPLKERFDRYVLWMKRYGVLPDSYDLRTDPFDPYAIDAKYWESFWWKPAKD